MDYPIDGIPGFEGRKVLLRPAGFFSGVKLVVDDSVVTSRLGKFTLQRNDGTVVEARLRSNYIDTFPQLIVDKTVYSAVKPLAWYELVWSALPILILFIGGALGAVCGLVAAYFNSRVFRMNMQSIYKYLLTGLISVGAFVVYFILSILFYTLIRGQ